MTRDDIVKALRCCTSTPNYERCAAECSFCRGSDMSKCIPNMGRMAADLLENDAKAPNALTLENAALQATIQKTEEEVEQERTDPGKLDYYKFPKILDHLGFPEALAQLAEEAAELSQAALKCRRALDGRNPTPKTESRCWDDLAEEYTDVIHCARVLGLTPSEAQIREKHTRWRRRLGLEENTYEN